MVHWQLVGSIFFKCLEFGCELLLSIIPPTCCWIQGWQGFCKHAKRNLWFSNTCLSLEQFSLGSGISNTVQVRSWKPEVPFPASFPPPCLLHIWILPHSFSTQSRELGWSGAGRTTNGVRECPSIPRVPEPSPGLANSRASTLSSSNWILPTQSLWSGVWLQRYLILFLILTSFLIFGGSASASPCCPAQVWGYSTWKTESTGSILGHTIKEELRQWMEPHPLQPDTSHVALDKMALVSGISTTVWRHSFFCTDEVRWCFCDLTFFGVGLFSPFVVVVAVSMKCQESVHQAEPPGLCAHRSFCCVQELPLCRWSPSLKVGIGASG